MDDPISQSLRYTDGDYVFERMPRLAVGQASLRQRRVLTRALHWIHRPWFMVRIPRGTAELTTTGRKSGKPRSTYVKAIRDGDKVYLVSIAGLHALWLKNIVANPEIRLRMTDGTFAGTARVLSLDDPERQVAVETFCSVVNPFDYFENAFHRRGRPSRRKIVELHRAWCEGGTPLIVQLHSSVARHVR